MWGGVKKEDEEKNHNLLTLCVCVCVLSNGARSLSTGEAKELRDAYDTSGASDDLRLFDESSLTCKTLRPGDGIFFHPMLAHGSGANTSDRRRRIATLWFVGGGRK